MTETAGASGEPTSGARPSAKEITWAVGAAVAALLLGYVYLEFVSLGMELLWTDVPEAIGTNAWLAGYALAMLLGGGLVVGVLRHRTGVFGHSPLDGLAVSDEPTRSSLVSLLAVLITLFCGAVLGPEAGLLALGTAIAAFLAKRRQYATEQRGRLINAAVIGAILALLVSLGRHGTISISDEPVSLRLTDLLSSAVVAVAAGCVTGLVRLLAYQLRRWADTRAMHPWRTVLVALLIGVVALIAIFATGVDPRMVLGSGEGYIREVVTMTSLATVLAVLAAKAAAYALSLGGGLRGGPIFPAMFLGAAVAAALVLLGLPGNGAVLAGAGVLASTAVGLAVKWPALIISAVALGLLLGGWQLIAPALIGLAIGRLVGLAGRGLPGVGPVPHQPSEAPATA